MTLGKIRIGNNLFHQFPIRAAHHKHMTLPHIHRCTCHNRLRSRPTFTPPFRSAAGMAGGAEFIHISQSDYSGIPLDVFFLVTSTDQIEAHLAAIMLRG